eukprot:2532643-Pyramimonas_sp.AAC.1
MHMVPPIMEEEDTPGGSRVKPKRQSRKSVRIGCEFQGNQYLKKGTVVEPPANLVVSQRLCQSSSGWNRVKSKIDRGSTKMEEVTKSLQVRLHVTYYVLVRFFDQLLRSFRCDALNSYRSVSLEDAYIYI